MTKKQTIGMASDHAGFELKEQLKPFLKELGYKIKDFGTNSPESMDYADTAHPLAEAVEEGKVDFGIAMCGSGNGISMTLNKHQGIRDALCWIPEIAALAKQHNNANIITLPARFISEELAREIILAYLNATFEGGRHQRRIDKIPCR
ncbi:MAG: ribose 5-phosphate isomerase B [Bacteroidales bacterium]|nr:ribose 5-phosphate isomerase B [Bacteroidales bacterium]